MESLNGDDLRPDPVCSCEPEALLPGKPDFVGPLVPEQMLAAGRYWYDESGQAHIYVGDGDSHLDYGKRRPGRRKKV